MKKRVNITLEYSTLKKCESNGIINLSGLINRLLDNHLKKIDSLIDTMINEKGYSQEDLTDLIKLINEWFFITLFLLLFSFFFEKS